MSDEEDGPFFQEDEQEDDQSRRNSTTGEGLAKTSATYVDNEYYNFLNVPRNASEAEINAAYKKLSRLYHPDKHLDEGKKKKAEILFAKLKLAHEGNDKHEIHETMYPSLILERQKVQIPPLSLA